MKNLDVLEQKRLRFAEDFRGALDKKDDKALAEAFNAFSKDIQQSIIAINAEYSKSMDSKILSDRGIRQLTSVEQKFYDGLMEAFKSPNPKAALSGLDLTFPETVIESVMEEIQAEHPLLNAIEFQNTTASVKWLFHDGSTPLASWGALSSEIIKEISGSIKDVGFDNSKLSAFIPIPLDLIELSAIYLDAYARIMLVEAIANGKEYGVVKGTGNKMPIGMIKDLEAPVVSGNYSDKEKVELNSFDPLEYCGIIANLAERPNGTYRPVTEVALIVNPKDYISKVIPATSVRTTDGTYKNSVFPFPTTVYTTSQLEEGEAVLGVSVGNKIKAYKAFYAGSLVKLDYSDEYQFLEDNRLYKAKMYAYGLPADNTSFIYLNISNLKPTVLNVKVVSDNNSADNAETAPVYVEVENPTGNPSESGYYELIGDNYVLSGDTEVDSEKTYYVLSE